MKKDCPEARVVCPHRCGFLPTTRKLVRREMVKEYDTAEEGINDSD